MRTTTTARLLAGLTVAAVAATGAAISEAAVAGTDWPSESTVRFAGQARAAGLTETQAQNLQRKVDERLAQITVKAHQTGYNEITADDGSAKLTLFLPGAAQAKGGGCTSGYLCLFAGDYYDHYRIDLFTCGRDNLAQWKFNDRLTSYKNAQRRGTKARFYNWQGGKWVEKFSSTAPHKEPDLGRYPGLNNMIDMVDPC